MYISMFENWQKWYFLTAMVNSDRLTFQKYDSCCKWTYAFTTLFFPPWNIMMALKTRVLWDLLLLLASLVARFSDEKCWQGLSADIVIFRMIIFFKCGKGKKLSPIFVQKIHFDAIVSNKYFCSVEVILLQVLVHKPKHDSSFDGLNKIFIQLKIQTSLAKEWILETEF